MSTETPIRGCTSSKVRQLMRRIAQHYDAEVSKAGLKTTQYSLLVNVAELGPIRPVDLAHRLKMTPSTLSRNLQPLIAAGWLEIGKGPDARSHLLSVSESGRAKRIEAKQRWKVAQRSLNALLGEERVLALHELIDESLDLFGGIDEADVHEP